MTHSLSFLIGFWSAVAVLAFTSMTEDQSDDPEKAASSDWCIRATLRQSIGFGVSYSRAPRVTVYDDRTVIFARRSRGDAEATYFITKLSHREYQSLDALLEAAYDAGDDDMSLNLVPGSFDFPSVTLLLYGNDQPKRVRIDGYGADAYSGPAVVSPTEEAPDALPEEIELATKALLTLAPDEIRQWEPEWVELKFARKFSSRPRMINTWPDNWPNLEAGLITRVDKIGQEMYSVVITAEKLAHYHELCKKSRYFQLGDRLLFAYWWEPVLPGTELWGLNSTRRNACP